MILKINIDLSVIKFKKYALGGTNELIWAEPEINISPVPDIVFGSQHFVPVTGNLCRSSVYDVLLKFDNLPVIVTDRKRILLVTHKIVPDSDR